jgi:pimeloyl-ACP methyl ester carboxylesterase
MIAPVSKLVDWSAIQLATLMMTGDDLQSALGEACEFLNGPDFVPAETQPAQVKFKNDLHFTFPTPRPCEFAENNVVHGRLYHSPGRWQERRAIILLPGWNDSASYRLRFPFIARRGNRIGSNVVTLVPPYHFQRRPRQQSEFERGDCLRFARAAAQAVAEIRAMTGWLLAQGCPAVSLWGFSMGAWHAGMTACYDARLASVVLACPPARPRPNMEQRALLPRIRRNLPRIREVCAALDQTPVNLTTIQPAISRKNILLIEGIHDLICPKEDLEALWQAWEQPDIWRLPNGHVAICCGFVPGLSRRVLEWLSSASSVIRGNNWKAPNETIRLKSQ